MIYYLGLGTNIGKKKHNLKTAILYLSEKMKILAASKIYKSSPMGPKNQPDYLNMALKIETSLKTLDLLKFVKNVELKMVRIKNEHWGPRIIDIDILIVDDQRELIDYGEILQIPHKGILERTFVLIPLEEIAPGLISKYFKKDFEMILKEAVY